jgi:hypothetical protein
MGLALMFFSLGVLSADSVRNISSLVLALLISGCVLVIGGGLVGRLRLHSEPGAPPNGGPAMRQGSSSVGGGPPSVS